MSLESNLNNSHSFISDSIKTKPSFDTNLETPLGANAIHHTYGICYQTITGTYEIETEESSRIHVSLNQTSNQLQHLSTAPSQNRQNYQSSVKLIYPQITKLNPTGKKETFLQI